MNIELVRKYNVAGPRYTSYPTVPFWNESGIKTQEWIQSVKQSFKESNQKEGISLYVHMPFCEQLCTFCGCNKRITKNHSVEEPYIDLLLKEWEMYLSLFEEKPLITEIHLGGGTPTFFGTENLKKLINGILSKSEKNLKYEFSFEGHPNNTTCNHLQTLFDLGFKRVSFGVQDYDEKVQQTIHRIQPFENVERVTKQAREIGYESVGHDLIFGLPFQTISNIEKTIAKTQILKPDRIAFYSYAHVPWIKGVGQRGFSENDLPKDEEKRALYEKGRELLEKAGYHEIGMDHFALESDSMYKSMQEKKLHRNFMGYTASKTQLMVGLGVSSISDSWYAFAQNAKTIEEYTTLLNENKLPVFRGHLLNPEDLIVRKHILNLMCHFETSWANPNLQFAELTETLNRLKEIEADGLIEIFSDRIKVSEQGKPFVRNICMAFDLRLLRNKPKTQLFSMTV
ncbi:MAG: oxygen-independent coproporphyrinogen III oxidase [Flavobacteriales bacterium]|nr:oxygen-independent coproporphyrinogen III oxidase [Flavobacteriales bacterium]